MNRHSGRALACILTPRNKTCHEEIMLNQRHIALSLLYHGNFSDDSWCWEGQLTGT